MRKLKLFMLLLVLMVGGVKSAWAVTAPTVSTPTVGKSYYLYNPKTEKFLARDGKNTYVLDEGLEWILEDAGSSKIKIRLKNRTEGYFWGYYWAYFADNYSDYEDQTKFILTDLGGNTYKLRTDAWGTTETYVYINVGSSNQVACNSHQQASLDADYTKWQFVTESDYIKYQLQKTASVDLTCRIVNPSFEHGTNKFNGWKNEGMASQNNTAFAKTETYYAEAYEPDGSKSVSQTLSGLPAGYYSLSARCLARGVTSAKLFAGSNETAITIEDASNNYSVGFYCDGSTNFDIGFEGVGTKVGTSWIAVDNFTLSYKPYISVIAEDYPSDGSLAADKWYVYTIPMTGDYYFSATSGVVYTTNGVQVYDEVTTSDAASKVSFTKDDKVYVKSTSTQTVTIKGRFYLATTVNGVTKWLNKDGSNITYAEDYGIPFIVTKDANNYYYFQCEDNSLYVADQGSNWVTKISNDTNKDWILESSGSGYLIKLRFDPTCRLVIWEEATGLVTLSHNDNSTKNVWSFVTPDDYANYAALVDINEKITSVGTLTYADPEKKPSVLNATSASDAASKVTSQTTALRAYVESNALGEGFSATDYTSYIINATCPGPKTATDKDHSSADGWDLSNVRFDGGGGWTGSSTSHDVYYASTGHFWGNFSGWSNVSLRQVVSELPTGKYLLTVRARSSGAIPTFYISGNGVQENITHPNGVFGNNWDDTSVLFPVGNAGNATILLYAQKESDATIGHWFSADNFRLVRIGDLDAVTISETATSAPTAAVANVTLTRTLSASYWNTFSVPFDMDIPSGWTVKELDNESTSGNIIQFKTASTIVAGKPYLVKPTSNVVNPTFNGVTIENTEGDTDGEGDYKFVAQIYNKAFDTYDNIAYLATDGKVKKLTSGGLKGLRAYFIIPSGLSEARIAFTDDETTGINEMKAQTGNDNIYDLSGRRVEHMKKGIFVVNGKKIVK